MREDEFINSLKDHADGFKVTPSAGLFDKIIVSGNLNNKVAEKDFANLLKEKASDFSVAPSAGLFDKINAASKTAADAEVEQFNHIVKNHAKDFNVTPSNGLFEKIVVTRDSILARRYAIYAIAAFLLLSISSFFYWLSHSTDALKNETVYISEGAKVGKTSPDQKSESNIQSKQPKLAEESIASDNSAIAKVLNLNSKSKKPNQTSQIFNKNNLFIAQSKENTARLGNGIANNEKAKLAVSASEIGTYSLNLIGGGGNSNINETLKSETSPTEKSATGDLNSKNAVANEKPIEQKFSQETRTIVTDNNSKPEVKEITSDAKANPLLQVSLKSRKKIVGTKWAIGIFGTPQLLKSEYHSNKTNENWANEYLKTKVQNDKSNFNFQAGLLIERKLSNSFSLITGIGMSEIMFRELRVVTYLTPSEASGTDITISTKEYIRKSSYDVTLNYLEVPFHIQYAKHWNKFGLAAQAGMAYNLLMDANAVVFDSDTMNTCIVQAQINLYNNMYFISLVPLLLSISH